jgi:hypothetical protein
MKCWRFTIADATFVPAHIHMSPGIYLRRQTAPVSVVVLLYGASPDLRPLCSGKVLSVKPSGSHAFASPPAISAKCWGLPATAAPCVPHRCKFRLQRAPVPGASALTGMQQDAKGQPSCFQHAPCPLLHALGKHTSARCHPARASPWAAAIVLVAEVRAAVKPPMEFLVGRSSFPRHTTLQVG